MRWPLERLERMRSQKEACWWEAMYQQDPAENPDGLWPDSYFGEHLWTDEFPSDFEMSALAVDPSEGKAGGDDSAIVFAGLSGGLYWVDASLSVRPPEEIVADAIEMAVGYAPHAVALESNLFQSLLAPEFDRKCRELGLPPLPIYLVNQHVPKTTRIKRLGPHLLRQHLRLRRTEGSRALVKQLRRFPSKDRDDGPDALELALRMVFDLSALRHRGPDYTVEFATT